MLLWHMSASPKQYDQVWAKWEKWFDLTAKTVYVMYHDRELFETMRDAIVERGPKDTGTWFEHYARMYLSKQAMAARRVMDTDEKAESFRRILLAMEESPQVFNRDRFMAKFSESDEWIRGERIAMFEKLRSPNGDWVDPEVIRYLRETLEADVDNLVTYATRVVAHPDKRGATLTWGELRKAIDDLGDAFQQFGAVFHGTHYELLPIVQDDWQGPFRRWLFEPFREWRDMNMMPGG